MGRIILLFHFICFALLGELRTSWAEVLNQSQLEMFVDELPHMPKIKGFHVVNGSPKAKSLTIGMFKKKWVSISFLSFLAIPFFSSSNLLASLPC